MLRLFIAFLVGFLFSACSKTNEEIEIDNPDETATVVMVYTHPTASDTAYFGFTGKNIKVDWGDGSTDSFPSLSIGPGEMLQNVSHKYAGGKKYIIKITSDELTYLFAGTVMQINLKRATKLRKLWIPGGDIRELDLHTNTLLEELTCDFNDQLGKLDLSNNSALTSVKVSGCQISDLNLQNCSKLKYLECDGNLLKQLDMSGNPELEILSCNFNKLESINLSKNSKLLQLDVGDNLLQEIDLSRNSKLYSLNIGANRITTLDLSGNPELQTLRVKKARLNTLNTSKNSKLRELHLTENNLSTLDISMNPALIGININSNNFQATELNKIFGMLSQSSSSVRNYIRITNNPGASGCNTNIAIQKNWIIYN